MSKIIVVTGCSSGFGKQAAEVLARKGHRVYATMRDKDGKNATPAGQLQNLATAEAIDLRVLEMDVTSTPSVDAAAAKILSESGAPDVVINNAGQAFLGLAEAFTAEELTSQLDINMVGVHRVNRAFLPAMRPQGRGLFINISSVAGRFGAPFNAIYHASKWALEGYSLGLRTELASSGIDLVVIEPGPFTTSIFPSMHHAADVDGRKDTYPPIVREGFGALLGAFDSMFNDPNVPTDPALVVDSMVDLIEMAPGTRPFRTVVGADFGVKARNAAVEPFDTAFLEAAGLAQMAKLKID
jgi:NAD(P)-dependent dehydrogenase (short-subunit alcohol dehydrogenase family)